MILTADSQAKAVIEAALFASGKTLSLRELADLSGLSVERARAMAGDLAAEYAARGSGIEIKSIGEGYFMQVAPRLAGQVVSCAPKEIEAPLIRTLAIIAYKQPIKQSELVKIRGNKSYEHVRELEKRGLISAEKAGHTKLLTTTPGFADYFGIVSGDPQSIRKALLQDRILIGVSPMYESLARRLALDYIVVNPYRPSEEDIARLKEIDLLILAPGYAERVKENYSGRMMEAGVRTLSQLKESAEVICRTARRGRRASGCGDRFAFDEFSAEGSISPPCPAPHPHDRGAGSRPAHHCAGGRPHCCPRLLRNGGGYPGAGAPAL